MARLGLALFAAVLLTVHALALPGLAGDALADASSVLTEIETLAAKADKTIAHVRDFVKRATAENLLQDMQRGEETLRAMVGTRGLIDVASKRAEGAVRLGDRHALDQALLLAQTSAHKIDELRWSLGPLQIEGDDEADQDDGSEVEVQGDTSGPLGPRYEQDGAPAMSQQAISSPNPALGDGRDVETTFGDQGASVPEAPDGYDLGDTVNGIFLPHDGCHGSECTPTDDEEPVEKPTPPPPPKSKCDNI